MLLKLLLMRHFLHSFFSFETTQLSRGCGQSFIRGPWIHQMSLKYAIIRLAGFAKDKYFLYYTNGPKKFFMQLSFASNTVTSWNFWWTVLRQSSDQTCFCTEFQTCWQKVQQSPNEVDMSLVKSQLIYFVQWKSALHDN